MTQGSSVAKEPRRAGDVRRTAILGLLFAPTTFGASAAAVVLPEASHRIGTSVASSSWLVAAYLLALAVGTPIFGRIGDQRGFRVVLQTALVTLAAGVALVLVGTGLPVLVAGRFLLGTGGAAASVTALRLASGHAVPSRFHPVAIVTTAGALAAGTGALVGGLFDAALTWRVPLMLPAVLALAIPGAYRMTPAVRSRAAGRVDAVGALLVTVLAGSVLFGLEAPTAHLQAALVGAVALVGLSAGALLSVRVRRTASSFLPLELVRSRGFRATAAQGAALFGGYFGILYAAPRLLVAQGASPIRVGAILAPATVLGLAAPLLISSQPRLSGAMEITALSVVSIAGIALFSAAGHSRVALVSGLALAFAGQSGGQVALIGRLRDLVGEAERGLAVGILNLAFLGGGSAATALAATLGSASMFPGAAAPLVALPALALGLSLSDLRGAKEPVAVRTY
jgi:DHA2 family metal-tetracycline-proton antiporter-like MFS transporter